MSVYEGDTSGNQDLLGLRLTCVYTSKQSHLTSIKICILELLLADNLIDALDWSKALVDAAGVLIQAGEALVRHG